MDSRKKLVFIHGPAGVGKSTTCSMLHQQLANSAWVESEWCGCTNPFDWSPERQLLVERNMSFLLRSYLECGILDYVILNWGLHHPRKQIFDRVLASLSDIEYRFTPIILLCSEAEHIRRMTIDGRSAERIKRSLETRPLYEAQTCPIIETTDLIVEQTVERVISIICPGALNTKP
ncbi:MAG: AAA family ATPase [Armatimonadota bacterium]